ncbi:phage portal protein [Caldovatus sediminis]|uniref:Phage portal protein n=1 Tax=Caldovatus sediminis TaxID=2041189 RepID=A0A8J3EEC6_9PROT|nr:phage portal protein [Caldovatus sediminis]GGG51645.1 phage portal protein [Caldovatus sediminis]
MSLRRRALAAVRAALSAFAAARDPAGRPPWRPPRGGPNLATGPAALTVAARARDAVRNNAYAARIVDLWVANAVGTGITTRWPKGSPHAEAWARWAATPACDAERVLSWPGIQALAMRAVVESGEALIRFRQVRPTPANPVGLELLVMEGDWLDWSRTGTVAGNRVVQGIETDAAGAPVAYWLLPHDDSLWPLSGRPREPERVPAAEIIHLFRRRRPGQMRDVSWLAPVLWPLRDLGQYEAALLRKAEIEACMAAIVTDDSEEALTGPGAHLLRDARGQAVEAFEPGMILYRRGGGTVDVVNPTSGGAHQGFAKRTLEAAAVGTGLTYDQVSGDLTQANYSSLRAGKIEFRSLLAQVQYAMLIPLLVDRVARRFHAAGAVLGLWPPTLPAVTHVPPAPEMVDPLKDSLALKTQVRSLFMPPQEAVGQFGYEWGEVVEMFRQANADMDEAGIISDIDPRRTAGAGGAQDAAQNAAVEIAATGAALPRDQAGTENA